MELGGAAEGCGSLAAPGTPNGKVINLVATA